MVEKRRGLANDLGIPVEDASRILIEKEKAIARSELKYHTKAICTLLDKMRSSDGAFAEQMMKETVKFIIARHGTIDAVDEICEYLENMSENFLERELADRMRDDY